MDDKTFAEQLKAARKATGLSQQGMADRMLISKRTIEKWEIGETGDGRTPPPYVQRFVLNELQAIAEEAKKHAINTPQRNLEILSDDDRIVRCKDCMHYTATKYTETGFHCGILSTAHEYVETEPDYFCCYGQRKTE